MAIIRVGVAAKCFSTLPVTLVLVSAKASASFESNAATLPSPLGCDRKVKETPRLSQTKFASVEMVSDQQPGNCHSCAVGLRQKT